MNNLCWSFDFAINVGKKIVEGIVTGVKTAVNFTVDVGKKVINAVITGAKAVWNWFGGLFNGGNKQAQPQT